MNNEWLNAYVLHRRPYREASYIVDFFTLEEGRVSAVAKGVKNSKSDKKSLLQPFQHLRLQLSGKSELKTYVTLKAFRLPSTLWARRYFAQCTLTS